MWMAGDRLVPYVFEAMGLGQTAGVTRPGPLGWAGIGRVWAEASFASVSARSAGFHLVPMDDLRGASVWVMLWLMVVGGATGGAAGGVGVVTLAAMCGWRVAGIERGREARLAGAVVVGFAGLVVVTVFLLLLVEAAPFEHLVFEGVSAATNGGLSLGATGSLTMMGEWVLIAAMFAGRVGPVVVLGWLVDGPAAGGARGDT